MTIEKFIRRNQLLIDQLERIASQYEHAEGGIFQPIDPLFLKVLRAQEQLINANEGMLDRAPNFVVA